MKHLRFDIREKGNKFKVLNATNGGPWHCRYADDHYRSNFDYYKSAKIPFSRNHDSNLCSAYGGPFCHDISAIFPVFDADVNDPDSYDFSCTDENIAVTMEAGTKIFFRLGQSIEHQIKKHHTLPPKDFEKWARICEHIIRHYNEGWANGFELGIKYWEIWNEPDDRESKRTWGGTIGQFFDLYEITAKHLKSLFPDLMIGGPSLAWSEEWMAEFLTEMKSRDVEIDFFSWHVYDANPKLIVEKAKRIKNILIDKGYGDAKSFITEWNYLEDWRDNFLNSIKNIHGMRGAAFVAALISESQYSPCIDMLMYYDTRPSAFCGVFDYYTYEPLKGYYPLCWYGMFYDMAEDVRCLDEFDNIYTLCGRDADGKMLCLITHYGNEDTSEDISVDFGRCGKYEIYLLDKNNDGEFIEITVKLEFTMDNNSCILIKEI